MYKYIPEILKLAVVIAFAYCVIMMVGCKASPTNEQLIDEALKTGDWSKVEAYETRHKEERELQEAADYCRQLGRVLVCVNGRDCFCATHEDLYGKF